MSAMERLRDMIIDDLLGDDSSSSDDSDDGDVPKKWLREREQEFDMYDDYEFVTRFRLSKRTVMQILELIGEKLDFPTHKNNPISPLNQLLCALRYYATSCTQSYCGEHGGFSASTANRIIRRVSEAIAELKPVYMQFPETETGVRKAQVEFYSIAKFPRAIGALDCTHIKIASPGSTNAELYRNIKKYFSLNVQAISNVNSEFTDIIAKWPGGTNDCTVFNNCDRQIHFENGRYKNAVLLVDRAYDCKPYLLSPLGNIKSNQENLYNESQIRSWHVVQKLFEAWKRRFPCLVLGLRVDLNKAMSIIVATAVLYNICQRAGEEIPPDDPDLDLPSSWEEIFEAGDMREHHADNALNKPHLVRHAMIEDYFRSLNVNFERSQNKLQE